MCKVCVLEKEAGLRDTGPAGDGCMHKLEGNMSTICRCVRGSGMDSCSGADNRLNAMQAIL